MIKERYTSFKEKDDLKNQNKTVISNEAYAILEALEEIKRKLQRLTLK